MKIGIKAGSHLLNFGGGAKEVIWHTRAFIELGHEVSIFVTSGIHPRLLPKFHGIPIRFYKPGCESSFEVFLTIDHFAIGLPLATKVNIQKVMFPSFQAEIPDGLTLVANTRYTASHIKDRWNKDAQVCYLPIESYYRVGEKEPAILHISRFAEPNEFADKAHRQMIQVMRVLQHELPGWRLILAGAVEYGQNSYVDALIELSKGLPVEFMFDPSDEEVVGLYSKASIYWHATGISLPMIPSAQEHFK